ncbi:hypothetical protein WG922_07015 [Ramlibacter sp. AN1015]|uniref:hypothetical protein n=1 Tax=Ramlibacter sp. AN1015 TaxID=3133428 RepID=UPI0030C12768
MNEATMCDLRWWQIGRSASGLDRNATCSKVQQRTASHHLVTPDWTWTGTSTRPRLGSPTKPGHASTWMWKFGLAAAAATAVALSAEASSFDLGVNAHYGLDSNEKIAELMIERNFKVLRMGLYWDQDQTAFRDLAARLKANGGRSQGVLQISYQWDHRCNQNLPWVENDAYNQTVAAVDKVKDVVHDFELLNEVQLRPEIQREVRWNSARTSAAPYEGKPCIATMVGVQRGMSRAIADLRVRSGLPLRVIVGVVGRDFGWLTFLRSKGVQWDVTGFHVYPLHQHRSLLNDLWYGPGGPLEQLASFGKPVHINEMNCGEIYRSDYENRAGGPATETCLKSLARHLKELRSQSALLESVHLYSLTDDPSKAAPENRFGLMYDLETPKPHLYLASAFAGGALSPHERLEITSRGLLSEAELPSRRSAADVLPPAR